MHALLTAQQSVSLDALHSAVRSLALPASDNDPNALQGLRQLLPAIALLQGWWGQAQHLYKCLARDLCVPLGDHGPLLSR